MSTMNTKQYYGFLYKIHFEDGTSLIGITANDKTLLYGTTDEECFESLRQMKIQEYLDETKDFIKRTHVARKVYASSETYNLDDNFEILQETKYTGDALSIRTHFILDVFEKYRLSGLPIEHSDVVFNKIPLTNTPNECFTTTHPVRIVEPSQH